MLMTTTTGPAGDRSGCQRYSPGLRSPGIIRSRSRGIWEVSAPASRHTAKHRTPASGSVPARALLPRRIRLDVTRARFIWCLDREIGGEGGIRTLDTGFGPYNCLAGSPVRPLQHLSARWYVPQGEEVILLGRAIQQPGRSS